MPVLLYEIYAGLGMGDQRVCHTIHNFRHQGVVGPDLLWATGLGRPEYFGARDRMGDEQDPDAINFTKGALLYANFVTTVSPHHAWEARHTDQGCGLGHPLHAHQRKFGGILNGIDYAMWNPESDPLIPVPFNADTLAAKYGNTQALRERLLLRDAGRPILAYVGPTRSAEGPAPHPSRAVLGPRQRRAVRAAGLGVRACDRRRLQAPQAASSTTTPTATSRSASTRTSRT